MARLFSFAPNGYGLPAVVSIGLHLVAVVVLLSGWSFNLHKTPERPEHIQAKLVTLAPKPEVKKGPSAAEIKRQEQLRKQKALEKKRRAEEQKKAEARRIAEEKKRAEAKRQALAKQKADAKRKAEQAKKAELAKKEQQRLAAEKAAREKAAKERRIQEEKRRAEQAKREADARRVREQAALEAEMSNLLAAEQEAQERAAASAASEAELIAGYSQLIQQQVAANWSRPPNARNGMKVLLLIQMVPTGEIVDVQVISSSGNQAFDHSAVQAVKLTNRVAELQDLSVQNPRLFERVFRRLKLNFEPEDLLL